MVSAKYADNNLFGNKQWRAVDVKHIVRKDYLSFNVYFEKENFSLTYFNLTYIMPQITSDEEVIATTPLCGVYVKSVNL